MNMLLPLIILVLLGCIYAGSLKNPNTRLWTVICVLLIILFLCYIQSNNEGFGEFSGYAPLTYNMQNGGENCTNKENSKNYADINNKLSPLSSYDGIKLDNRVVSKPLGNNPIFWSPVGDGYVLKDAMNSENFPTIDGKPGSPKSMFVLKNNTVSWDCCPSTFGAGQNGCVCYSPEQLKMFQGRGANLTAPQEYPGI